MCRWHRARRPPDYRPDACAMLVSPLADLSLIVNRLPRVPQLSMGHIAFGNRFPRNLLCAIATAAPVLADIPCLASCPLAPALALVQTPVPIWLCEIAQRGSLLAQLHSPDVSLRNPATPHLARVVRASTSVVGAKDFHVPDVRD